MEKVVIWPTKDSFYNLSAMVKAQVAELLKHYFEEELFGAPCSASTNDVFSWVEYFSKGAGFYVVVRFSSIDYFEHSIEVIIEFYNTYRFTCKKSCELLFSVKKKLEFPEHSCYPYYRIFPEWEVKKVIAMFKKQYLKGGERWKRKSPCRGMTKLQESVEKEL